jgi:hypothetical protein
MPLEELTVGKYLTYQEYPVKILDTPEKVTWNNCYKMCQVQWSNHIEEEATWEKEDQLKAEFPEIFSNLSESRREIHPKGGRFVAPRFLGTFKTCQDNTFHLISGRKFFRIV